LDLKVAPRKNDRASSPFGVRASPRAASAEGSIGAVLTLEIGAVFPLGTTPGRKPCLSSVVYLAALPLAVPIGCGRSQTTAGPSLKNKYSATIREVPEQDKPVDEKCRQDAKADRLAVVQTYVRALRRIDLRQCRLECQEGWYACEKTLPFLQKYPDDITGNVLKLAKTRWKQQ
jgi:hypothetical protein